MENTVENELPKPKFRYEPLQHNQIRLLQLRASSDYDEKRCLVSAHDLNSLPPYVALSYRWGSTTDRIPIRIGTQTFEAMPNAWWALHYLGLPAGSYVWIDAICIDQDNIQERNAQVQIMGEIYSRASEVFVWLGLEDQQSAIAFEALQSTMKLSATETNTELIESYCSALMDLFENDYWSRTWIIQEIIFARKITLVCGQQRVIWDLLDVFLTQVLPKWKTDLTYVLSKRELFRSIAALGDHTASALVSSRKDFLTLSRSSERWEPRQLYDFLQSYRGSQCFDPRDKIYGILGVFNRIAAVPMQVDYSKSVEGVLMSSLAYILEEKVTVARSMTVGRELQTLFGVDGQDEAFQAWLRPRLSFGGEGAERASFRCHLDNDEILEIPMATYRFWGSIRSNGQLLYVPVGRTLDLDEATSQEVALWPPSARANDTHRTRVAQWLVRHKSALTTAIRNTPCGDLVAIEGDNVRLRVDPLAYIKVKERFTRSYVKGAPLCSSGRPKVVTDENRGVMVVCAAAQPGDIVSDLDSEFSPYGIQYVLRPSKTGVDVIGTALVVVDSWYADSWSVGPIRNSTVFLDPLNILALSSPFLGLERFKIFDEDDDL